MVEEAVGKGLCASNIFPYAAIGDDRHCEVAFFVFRGGGGAGTLSKRRKS